MRGTVTGRLRVRVRVGGVREVVPCMLRALAVRAGWAPGHSATELCRASGLHARACTRRCAGERGRRALGASLSEDRPTECAVRTSLR